MAIGTNIRTWFQDSWHYGNVPVIRSADHGAWLGSTVFDGARWVDGMAPDLEQHLARLNESAKALMITPSVEVSEMLQIIKDGLHGATEPVYIRPMYWALDGDDLGVPPKHGATGFCICLENVPMAPADAVTTLTTTRFRRPTLDCAVVNAKAGCLYPNNARILAEAREKGFDNALVCDSHGNVAETAVTNVFMVRDGVVFTPIANGTFLAGITRARHIDNLRADGVVVHECVLTLDDFRRADEIFLTGNMSKITPVVAFDEIRYPIGSVTKQARSLYWDWAANFGQRI